MTEPKYDEDVVNLGYLNKVLNNEIENAESITISRHYASRPKPPYYAGDTWIDGNIVYNCINTRLIGIYTDSDWVTESGAKEEAERKNKIFLTQPSNYSAGDMWILQSDEDHVAGKRGEILTTTVGRRQYEASDWVSMLSYDNISSINEVVDKLNKAINQLITIQEATTKQFVTMFYSDTVPIDATEKDLWYVTDESTGFLKENLYQYVNNEWQHITDANIVQAFKDANSERLIEDEKIVAFYTSEEPTDIASVGDMWIDIANDNKLYRHNGTNWIQVYETYVDELIENVDSVTRRTVEISTDLGQISQTVSETETKLYRDYSTKDEINADLDVIRQEQNTLQTQFTQTTTDFNFLFNNLREVVDSNSEDTTERFLELTRYIRFVDGNILLGQSDSAITLTIENDRISFQQNGTEIAYISDNKLFITEGEFLNSLKLGNFAFIPRTNGNLSFKKVGGN